MAKFERQVTGDFEEVLRGIHSYIMNSAMSIQQIDEVRYEMSGVQVATKVYDKYYMRSSNRASLTVTVIGDGENIQVSAIGAGGGNGAFINFSWGAEEDFISTVPQALRKMNL